MGEHDASLLARRLFAGELQGAFPDAVQTYAKILGKTGLAEYRRLVEIEWSKVKAKPTKIANQHARQVKSDNEEDNGKDYGKDDEPILTDRCLYRNLYHCLS